MTLARNFLNRIIHKSIQIKLNRNDDKFYINKLAHNDLIIIIFFKKNQVD